MRAVATTADHMLRRREYPGIEFYPHHIRVITSTAFIADLRLARLLRAI
jgi:hypothetical protein